MGRRTRRRAGEAAGQSRSPGPSSSAPAEGGSSAAPPPDRYARSEARNAAARERLEPLREGERPHAVTVGAALAVALVLANLVALLTGRDLNGRASTLVFFLVWSVILLSIAAGMWRNRYWAVLGMQALLAVAMVIFSVVLFTAGNLAAVAISLAVVIPAGTLFWLLVKAMARIQMPTSGR